jgi:biotin carboxylase
VLCETDTGLRTAELLAATLELPSSNGVNEARRDKYMMQQALAAAGLPHIRQVLTENWTEVEAFIKNTGFPIVIKPCRGSASRNVSKCENKQSAQKVFELLLGYPGYANGTLSDAVLVQEYITGHEYVVDTVSSNGEHKIVAIWKYDKRELSGAPFVYYCTELVTETNDCISNLLIEYSTKVLDALGVKYGPAHIEIKIDDPIDDQVINGPLLIEVSERGNNQSI